MSWLLQNPFPKNGTTIHSENNQMTLVKNKQNIPAPEPDSIPDSSSPDSSSPEAGSIPDESSPETDSIPDKLGKLKVKVIVNHQYIKAMIKKLLRVWCRLFFRNLVLRELSACSEYCNNQVEKTTTP